MFSRKLFVMFIAVVFIIGAVGSASAGSSYVNSFTSAYPSSATKSFSCSICHVPAGPSARNLYGAAWASASKNFKNIESQDSDGDGATNIVEINAGTNPGDPGSKPPPAPTACTGYTYSAWSALRRKRPADQDSDRQHPSRMHRDTFDPGGVDPGMYADGWSVHRVYIFSMVRLRRKRPADQDSDRQHPCRMHRDAFDCSKVDQGMYADGWSVHRVYIFGMVRLRRKWPADQDSDRQHPCRMHRDAFDCGKVDQGMYYYTATDN